MHHSPPVLLAISSLREVQWEIVPATQRQNAQINWSGETIRGTWYHVAIVNDPASATTIMYVEGAPVLRNVGNAGTGMQPVGPALPWIIGASWYAGFIDGYYGSLGETRIVARPLPSSQWLMARRA